MLSLSGEWLFFHLFVKVQTPLPTFLFLFFPFYREERDSWQTSAGRKVKVDLGGLDVPSISTLLVFFFNSFFTRSPAMCLVMEPNKRWNKSALGALMKSI